MSTATSSLDGLPVELTEDVVRFLELPDICNLRLASRTLAAEASHGSFQDFFRSREVCWLDKERLQRIMIVTAPDHGHGLGSLLENLTIIGRVDDDELVRQDRRLATQNARSSLLKIFANIKPRSLTLEVQDKRSWKRDWSQGHPAPIWECVAQTLELAATLLVKTGVRLDGLHLFASSTSQCGLGLDCLTSLLDRFDLAALYAGLRQLSLKLSKSAPLTENDGKLDYESETAVVHRMLSLCPSIEFLRLEWYTLGKRWQYPLTRYERESEFLLKNLTNVPMLSLQHLRLAGFCCGSKTILHAFITSRNASLRSFHMKEVAMNEEMGFAPIFNHITANLPLFVDIELEDLFESTLICFDDEPGRPKCPTMGHNGPDILSRKGPSARKPIRYYNKRNRFLGSPALHNWKKDRAFQYGPPRYR